MAYLLIEERLINVHDERNFSKNPLREGRECIVLPWNTKRWAALIYHQGSCILVYLGNQLSCRRASPNDSNSLVLERKTFRP